MRRQQPTSPAGAPGFFMPSLAKARSVDDGNVLQRRGSALFSRVDSQ